MIKMPFGLYKVMSTYQQLMSGVLQSFIVQICLEYLDDVIVFSKKRSNHIADMQDDLERIRSAGFKIKPAKNVFCYAIRCCICVI